MKTAWWRRLLPGTALVMAALEVLTAFYIEVPVAAIVFALIFLGFWWWLRQGGGIAPVIALGILFAVELVFVPFYERNSASDWIVHLLVAAVGVVGLVAAFFASVRRPRAT